MFARSMMSQGADCHSNLNSAAMLSWCPIRQGWSVGELFEALRAEEVVMGTGEALPVAAASPVELRHLFGQWLSITYMAFAQVNAVPSVLCAPAAASVGPIGCCYGWHPKNRASRGLGSDPR